MEQSQELQNWGGGTITHLVPIMGSTPKVGAIDGRAFVPVKPMLKKRSSDVSLLSLRPGINQTVG